MRRRGEFDAKLAREGRDMQLLARDVMQRNVGIIEAESSLAELERAFEEAEVSGFPVVHGGRVVGVVSRADVVRQLGGKSGETPRLSTFYADLSSFEAEHVSESFADAATRGGQAADELRVSELMTESAVTVPPDASLEDVARVLVSHKIHRVLVTDDRTLVGIVSSLDLVRLLAEEKLVPAAP
jgi:CBS domain-containing protein